MINAAAALGVRERAEPAAPAAKAPSRGRQRRRIWLALLGGFGGLLVLMIGAGIDAQIVLGRLHASGTEMRRRFERRSGLLEQIRSQIYMSGTYVRDYLLAPEPAGAGAQLARLQTAQRDTNKALREYERDLAPEELATFRELRSEIQEYWRVLDRAFDWTPAQRNARRDAFFYEELVPRRTAMLQVADRVANVNELELAHGENGFSRDFERFRWASITTLSITLIGGLLVTGLTITYLLRLEREAQLRLEESGRAQADLKELSAKLVRAQEEERRAISRELHDEVGQSLSAIVMETDNLLDFDHAAEVRSRLEAVHELAARTVEETRNMSLLLRPSMLDDFGLVPALQWQARDAMRRTGLRVQVDAPEMADGLPEEHKTCIYRIVQESLNNAARHAQASAVQVTVRRDAAQVLVSVQDDGSGFDTKWTRGLGLLGMEERVRHLGGRFEIDSKPGRGTFIRAALPVTMFSNGNGAGPHTEPDDGSHPHPAG